MLTEKKLKKFPVKPSKWTARDILQKCGLSFREAQNKINEVVATHENISTEEAKKYKWYLTAKMWKDLWTEVIYEEDLFTIGYER